jgi:hypothetical protein
MMNDMLTQSEIETLVLECGCAPEEFWPEQPGGKPVPMTRDQVLAALADLDCYPEPEEEEEEECDEDDDECY